MIKLKKAVYIFRRVYNDCIKEWKEFKINLTKLWREEFKW